MQILRPGAASSLHAMCPGYPGQSSFSSHKRTQIPVSPGIFSSAGDAHSGVAVAEYGAGQSSSTSQNTVQNPVPSCMNAHLQSPASRSQRRYATTSLSSKQAPNTDAMMNGRIQSFTSSTSRATIVPIQRAVTSTIVALSCTFAPIPVAGAQPAGEVVDLRTLSMSAAASVDRGDIPAGISDYIRAYKLNPSDRVRVLKKIVELADRLDLTEHRELIGQVVDLVDRYLDEPGSMTTANRKKWISDRDKIRARIDASKPDPVLEEVLVPPASEEESVPQPAAKSTTAPILGTPTTDRVTKSPLPELARAPETSHSPSAPPPDAHATTWQHLRGRIVGGNVSLGLGAGFLAMMIAGLAQGQRWTNRYTDESAGSVNELTDNNVISQGHLWNRLAIAGGVFAGAALVIGAALLATGVKGRRRATAGRTPWKLTITGVGLEF